jgi:16S rRNA (cytosine1402-N4)-methyltransferase
LIANDVDAEALREAKKRLSAWKERVTFVRENFRNLREILDGVGVEQVDGILFDLGMSSAQLQEGSRGFALSRSGVLDMRFDRRQRLTAAEIVNRCPEKEMVRILREFGEERRASRIAAAIVRRRKRSELSSTTELAELVAKAVGRRRGRIHPATKTFQSLRVVVNAELECLREALPQAIKALKPGGRLIVIAYHSLDDRIVKQTFREFERGCICPPSFPVCRCGRVSEVKVLTRKPVRPSEAEIEENPRSRSGRMRVCERRGAAM